MSAPPPADRAAPVAPPPADVPLVQQVAEILLLAYALDKTAELIAALLAPYRISQAAVAAVLKLAATAHTPRPVLAPRGIARYSPAAEVVRKAARADVYFRAAYVTKAAGRIQRELDASTPLPAAVRSEAANFAAHKAARDKRLAAAARTASSAELHGPLLGWYRNWALDSDADCRVADGNNFYIAEGTIIGWPGAVHPECGCSAGPPHEDGGMVNDVLGDVLGRMSPSAAPGQVLKLRAKAG